MSQIKPFTNNRDTETDYMFGPAIINLELTNACNMACVFCDRTRLAEKMHIGEMEERVLEKILSDVSKRKFFELGLVGLGEPLLDSKLKDHLAIISSYRNVFDRISINTNGVALTEEKADMLCRSCINHITFSLNATNQKAYLDMMHYDYYDTVVGNIRMFMERRQMLKRDDLKVCIQAMTFSQNDRVEFEREFESERKEGVCLFIREVYNKPALQQEETKGMFKISDMREAQRYPCWSIFSRIYIDVDGNLYPCTIGNDCYRTDSDLCIGSVKDRSVLDLFNDPRLIDARQKTINGSLPFCECANCNVWTLLPNNFDWNKEKQQWVHRRGSTRLQELDVPTTI